MRLISFAVLSVLISFATLTAGHRPVVLDDGIEILLVEDVPGRTMSIDLFEGGPLTREQKLTYMPGGEAPSSVNVFLVKTGGKTYLIDAGFGNAVRDGKIDPAQIAAVLITHAHGDHVAGLLREDGTAYFTAPVFMSIPESQYWLDPKTESDLQKNIAKTYGDRYRTFSFGDTLAPGIVAIDASGHTPGHTVFLIGTGNKKVLIIGDLLHAAALQFPHPEECARFDMNREKSVETRRRLLQMAADNNWLVAGIHFPVPGLGTVRNNGRGGFDYTPYRN
ncbi:MAG: MBL fold metallo-hydrolase [Chitinispirillales bacterium]|nr:MBL fold metallo-hydrolase [Chitinispirillales bacterium]